MIRMSWWEQYVEGVLNDVEDLKQDEEKVQLAVAVGEITCTIQKSQDN